MSSEKFTPDTGLFMDISSAPSEGAISLSVNPASTALVWVTPYDYIDWYIQVFSAGAALITIAPQVGILPDGDTKSADAVLGSMPYIPDVAGVGATPVYPWTMTFAHAGPTSTLVFRTPTMGNWMNLTITLDAGTGNTVAGAFHKVRGKHGGPR